MSDTKITKAIEKLASGYSVSETVEEYAVVDGELTLVKKKQTKKEIAPDIKAIMYLLEDADLSLKSDEELNAEKERLKKLERELNYDE